jgi:hypothetical protein
MVYLPYLYPFVTICLGVPLSLLELGYSVYASLAPSARFRRIPGKTDLADSSAVPTLCLLVFTYVFLFISLLAIYSKVALPSTAPSSLQD